MCEAARKSKTVAGTPSKSINGSPIISVLSVKILSVIINSDLDGRKQTSFAQRQLKTSCASQNEPKPADNTFHVKLCQPVRACCELEHSYLNRMLTRAKWVIRICKNTIRSSAKSELKSISVARCVICLITLDYYHLLVGIWMLCSFWSRRSISAESA